MRLAIFENAVEHDSYESKLNRMLSEEFIKKGHEVSVYIPNNHTAIKLKDINIKVINEIMPNDDSRSLLTKVLSVVYEWKRQRVYKYLYMEIMQTKIDALCMYVSHYKRLKSLYSSVLLRSPLPIVLLFDKIERKENIKFLNESRKFLENKNIKIVVLSFTKELLESRIDNMVLVTAEMLNNENEVNGNVQEVSNESFAELIEKIIK